MATIRAGKPSTPTIMSWLKRKNFLPPEEGFRLDVPRRMRRPQAPMCVCVCMCVGSYPCREAFHPHKHELAQEKTNGNT